MRKTGTIALALAATIGASTAPPALAGGSGSPPVRCGQVISHDTRLSRDLLNCPGTALTIGADRVTLDLGGHLVDGVNAPGSEGIAVDGHAGVTIENGAVRDFRVNGVALRAASHARVSDLAIKRVGAGGAESEDVSAGLFVDGSDGVEIDGNRISNDVEAYQSDGIVVLGSKRPEITRNDTSRNAWNGIVVVESPRARVLRNRTVGNVNSGILVVSSASAVIARNFAADHVNDDTGGIVLLVCERCLVVGNDLSGNEHAGISVENGTTATKIVRNRVRGGGDGILVLDSDANTVSGNDVRDVGGVGIVLDSFGVEGFDGSDGNAIAENTVLRSGFDGILVLEGSDGNRLARNTSSFNAGRGIDAVPSTIDGGGNRAYRNGLSPQCTGVFCR